MFIESQFKVHAHHGEVVAPRAEDEVERGLSVWGFHVLDKQTGRHKLLFLLLLLWSSIIRDRYQELFIAAYNT